MSSPTKSLPEAYHLAQTIDLGKNPRLVIWLNIAALAFFILFGYLYLRVLAWIRPAARLSFGGSGWLVTLAALLLAYIGVIILHELVPSFEAVAVTGKGVFETLKAVAKQVLFELKKHY